MLQEWGTHIAENQLILKTKADKMLINRKEISVALRQIMQSLCLMNLLYLRNY